jgi:hypothetical protein
MPRESGKGDRRPGREPEIQHPVADQTESMLRLSRMRIDLVHQWR